MSEPPLELLAVGEAMKRLQGGLVAELARHPDAAVQRLGQDVTDIKPSDNLNIVVVGQHDAGKSLLARCLTGREDIEVGAGPLTDRSTAYEWNGHRLVDTPGVRSGHREHDQIAGQALKAADVVLFVLTVEGLDDVIAEYFTTVRREMRSVVGLVLVINKALSERNDRAVAEADLARTIGDTYNLVPVVWTDAKRWADAPDDDPLGWREQSQVRELATVVTDLLEGSGAVVRLLRPLRSWSDTAQEALRVLSKRSSGDSADLQQLDALAQQLDEQYVEQVRAIERRTREAEQMLLDGLLVAGPDISRSAFERLVQRCADHFDERNVQDGAALDDALVAVQGARHDGDVVPLVDVPSLLRQTLNQVSRTFSGPGARPSGAGHEVVKVIGHALGHTFGSWGIVRIARNIGSIAGRLNVALTVANVAWAVFSDARSAQQRARDLQRLNNWPDEAATTARTTTSQWAVSARSNAEQLHQVRTDEVARRRLDVLLRLTSTDQSAVSFVELDRRSRELIRVLSGGANDAGT